MATLAKNSKSFKTNIKLPMDGRSLVTNFNDLLKQETWNTQGAVYNGMVVSVVDKETQECGLYMLIDFNKNPDYTNSRNWHKIASWSIKDSLISWTSWTGSKWDNDFDIKVGVPSTESSAAHDLGVTNNSGRNITFEVDGKSRTVLPGVTSYIDGLEWGTEYVLKADSGKATFNIISGQGEATWPSLNKTKSTIELLGDYPSVEDYTYLSLKIDKNGVLYTSSPKSLVFTSGVNDIPSIELPSTGNWVKYASLVTDIELPMETEFLLSFASPIGVQRLFKVYIKPEPDNENWQDVIWKQR